MPFERNPANPLPRKPRRVLAYLLNGGSLTKKRRKNGAPYWLLHPGDEMGWRYYAHKIPSARNVSVLVVSALQAGGWIERFPLDPDYITADDVARPGEVRVLLPYLHELVRSRPPYIDYLLADRSYDPWAGKNYRLHKVPAP